MVQSVSGRVLLSELNKVGSTRRNVAVEASDYVSKVVVESKDLAQSFSGPLLYVMRVCPARRLPPPPLFVAAHCAKGVPLHAHRSVMSIMPYGVMLRPRMILPGTSKC